MAGVRQMHQRKVERRLVGAVVGMAMVLDPRPWLAQDFTDLSAVYSCACDFLCGALCDRKVH